MGSIGFIWLTSDEQVARLIDGTDDLKRVCYGAYGASRDRLLDLGKTWGALHFLLTGTKYDGSPPLNFILSGGRGIDRDPGDCDIRFVRAFSSALLSEIDTALQSLDRAEIRRRFDGRGMDSMGVGPGSWSECGDVIPPHLLAQLDDVRNHVHIGAQSHLGMLVWLE